MSKLLLTFYLLLVVGLILMVITYRISNEIIFMHTETLKLGDYSSASINLPEAYGDMKIVGEINGSARFYLIKGLQEKYLGNFSGKFELKIVDNSYERLFILNNQYPSNATFTITIYNTGFAGIGYPIAGTILAISAFLGVYVINERKNKSKKRKYRRK